MGLGDALMDTGRARVQQQTDPRKCRVTFKGRADRWSPMWDGNPRIAGLKEAGDFQEVVGRDANNMRGYHFEKTPQRWVYNPAFRADVGEIYFAESERVFGERYSGRVILEPHIKPGASPNKQWGWVRWSKLAYLLQEKRGLKVTQLGPLGTRTLEGAEHIVTPSFRMAAAVLGQARAVVLPEGGCHHAAAALGVPGVVIFGGFTPVELTGYALHRNLGASVSDACGLRVPCKHCAEWMTKIAPEAVAEQLVDVLKQRMACAA